MPGRSASAMSWARIPGESSAPESPSSHSISSARRACSACQYVSATTATPAAHPAAHAPLAPIHELGSSATTWRTPGMAFARSALRSEEHTSELQSHSDLVCRLLLEKKKKLI